MSPADLPELVVTQNCMVLISLLPFKAAIRKICQNRGFISTLVSCTRIELKLFEKQHSKFITISPLEAFP